MKEYITKLFCDHCDKETTQKINDSEHERDSSGDTYECLVCGWIMHGITGEYVESLDIND